MIILVNPRATRPKNRRFPLSVMSLGAVLPEGTSWKIVDGNRPGLDTLGEITAIVDSHTGSADEVRAVAMTVMPGPQLVSAVPLAKRVKQLFPEIPIIWGGYFPSLYPKPVLRARYVDWVVRGQGEKTFLELLEVIDGRRDPKTVAGLAFHRNGSDWLAPERTWLGPDAFPPPPYDKIDVHDYLRPTFLGERSAVYQASIGCPYSCNFCGVISALGSRQEVEDPATTAANLGNLVKNYGIDSVHFYDNNFFLKEDHAQELCERLTPLGIAWWCEARIDAMLRFSDKTWSMIKRAGLKMVYTGAESGSDAALKKMSKRLTTEETLMLAERTRSYGIIPEFSFMFADPDDPETDIETTLAFVRRLKRVNPDMELVAYFYTPTPQRRGTYGNVDPLANTPDTLEEWTEPQWVQWMMHLDPEVPWMPHKLKARVEDFELVLKSRFPSVHDTKTRPWGKALARVLAQRRWKRGDYDNPRLLRAVRRWARTEADDREEYGHLRPPGTDRK